MSLAEQLDQLIAEVRKAEREACAELCIEIMHSHMQQERKCVAAQEWGSAQWRSGASCGAEDCLEAIRKRNTEGEQ